MAGIYEFQKEDAFRFASGQMIQTKTRGNELEFKFCPYCHGGRSRDKGTFSINLSNGQFQCKRSSCSVSGNMITLAKDFDFELSESVTRYYNLNNRNNDFRKFKDAHKIHESRDAAIEYMKSRGISEEVCKRYEITTMPDKENIIVFPFKNAEGELKFVKYRNTAYVKGQGNKEWCESNCMPILFGMNHCEDFGTLVITEGQIDSLTLAECGVENAVSVPTGKNGFTWIPHCWDWVCKFSEIVIFGDCENGIITLAKDISNRFPNTCRIVRFDDYKGLKDANELFKAYGPNAIKEAINNAETVISSSLKKVETVQAVDIEKMHFISTGVPELDKLLSNGFHDGEVVLLSGERGNGKSTWASQLLVDALSDRNVAGMIYSGELPDFFVKNWLDRQIAGKRTLNNHDIDDCNDFYRNRLYIYDNSNMEDDSIGLLEAVEQAMKLKAVKFVVLDNLMTALDDCSNNETLYRAQSNFVGRCAKLAKLYNSIIILVAHPRKRNNQNFTNDDVSGSADITNKVNIVMSYDRVPDGDPEERTLVITKNRLTGRLGEVRLKYSEDSKRIVGINQGFEKGYLNNTDGFGYELEYEIPFE